MPNDVTQVQPDHATEVPPDPTGAPAPRPATRRRGQPGLTKVSANFVPRAVVAMEIASELTQDNQTDVLNRAVQLYAYLMKAEADGKLIFTEDPRTGAKERLVLL